MRTRLTALTLALGLFAAGSAYPAQAPAPAPRQPQPAPGFPAPGGFPGQPGFPGGARPGIDYKEVVPQLIEALKDSDADVRQSAAAALAAVGQPAVGPLLDILKDKSDDKELRANAAYVLGHMGGAAHEAVPILLKLLKDSDTDVRRRAAYALQLIVKETPSGGMGGLGMPGMGGPGAMMGGGRPAGHSTLKANDPGLIYTGGAPASAPKGADKTEKKESK
jgi:hypothetical protein